MPIVYALVSRGKVVLAEFTNTSGEWQRFEVSDRPNVECCEPSSLLVLYSQGGGEGKN